MKINLKITVQLVLCLLLCAYQLCVAGEDIEHVLVTDEKAEYKSVSEVDLDLFTGFYKVIDREDFADRFTSFTQVLDSQPGVQVNESGGVGSFSSLSFRGSAGKQVNVFLDGMLLNSPSSGNASVQYIPSVLVDSIEVYPDFTPAQLGNANLAGAANFKSRNLNKGEKGGQLRTSIGSFFTKSLEFSTWNEMSGWQVMGALGRLETENNYSVDSEIFRTNSEERINDGFEQNHFFLKASTDTEDFTFDSIIQHSDSTKEIPTTLNQRRDNALLETKNIRAQSVIDYSVGEILLANRVYMLREDEEYIDIDSTVGLGANNVETALEGFGVFQVIDFSLSSHQFVASFEYRHDEILQNDLLEHRKVVEVARDSLIGAFSDTWKLAKDWQVNTTARAYLIKDSLEYALDDRASEGEVDELVYQLGLSWRASKYVNWKTNIGRLIRVPTLGEKFVSRGVFEGEPELSPEKTTVTVDTGFDLTAGNLSCYASAYFRRLSDGIVTIYDSRGVGRPQNISESEVKGVEAQLIWALSSWVELKALGNIIDSENKSDIRAFKGNYLPGIYHENFGVSTSINREEWNYNLRYMIYDQLYYNAANAVKADKKEDLSSSITYSKKNISIDLTVRNIFDKNYLDLNRFPTPGRSYLTTITLDF